MTSRGPFRRGSSRRSFPIIIPTFLFSIFIFSYLVLQLFGFLQDSENSDPKSAELLILHRAAWFMPESLRRVLERHRQELELGLKAQPLATSGNAAGRSQLEVDLRRRVLTIDDLLRSKPRFGDLAREMGGVARLIIYLNMPEGESLSSPQLDFVLRYIHKNSPNFPLVVYDDPGQEIGTMEDFLHSLCRRRVQLSKRLQEAYPEGMVISSLGAYDFRSTLFGVSSLVYSHSINDIARLWLSTWKAANGDMTGRPRLN